MSFGSLKTLKLERTLGDSVLSITKHVPTEADEVESFKELDKSIVEAALNLTEVGEKEAKVENKSGYPAITSKPSTTKPKEVKEETKEEVKPKKRGRGRPPKEETTEPKKETKAEPLKPTPKEEYVDQDAKTELVQKFQEVFESDIGFTSEDTYEKEFNEFFKSLINMTYAEFLEANVTASQLKTFKELI